MTYNTDSRIVMTLDAGGTNLVFNAIQRSEQIIEDIVIPTIVDNLDKSLDSIIDGFNQVKKEIGEKAAAISFAFPGPADYPNGIIGDLPNLTAFRGGVALGPILEEKFKLPVFINNDGNLYAYGEAIAGYLPYLNNLLEKESSFKRYKNLLGLTFGTGFGAGFVRDGILFLGDNSNAGEIWRLRDKLNPIMNVEEHVSVRGIKSIYAKEAGIDFNNSPEPKDIYKIFKGELIGNKEAAVKAFQSMGEAAGDAISNAIALIDGIIVIGGGLAGAASAFLPYLVKEMNSEFISPNGNMFKRLTANVYNLENKDDLDKFLRGSVKEIPVYGSNKKIKYDPEPRIGVGITKIGTSKAISLGAYAFALTALDLK